MMGELMCLGVYNFIRSDSEKKSDASTQAPAWVFLVPCACDWTATTLVNGAYIFLPASIIQMTRGAIVMFTCAFSILFLGKRQEKYHFLGVFLVFMGITVVSCAAVFDKGMSMAISSVSAALFGITLCIGGQVFQASM